MERLRKLSEAMGPPGSEEEIVGEVKSLAKGYDEVSDDRFGNIFFRKGSGEPVVMLVAHMDEIGFSVKYIDENGFIYFVPLGGFWSQTVINQRVVVLGDKKYHGTIGSKPPHIMEKDEMEKPVKLKDMFIDIGASSREEVLERGIDVGTPVVWDSRFCEMGDVVMGKAMDDRAGVWVLLELMKEVEPKGTALFVFSAQEEVGLKGARVASFHLEPDYAIAVDVGMARSAGIQEREVSVDLGKGPIVTFVESSGRGLIASKFLNRKIIDAAKSAEVPYQVESTHGGMTDAAIIYMTGKGIPSASLGIPARYIHSPNEMVHKHDLRGAVDVLREVLESGI